MFWNKKESKDSTGLPDLEPTPRISLPFKQTENEDDETYESHALPSFPDSPNKNGFSQAAIKDAIGVPKPSSLPSLDNFPEEKTFKTVEESSIENLPSPPQIPEIREDFVKPMSKKDSKNQDLFVKIDNYNNAKKNIQIIKAQVEQAESLLKKIRETKMREEQDLSSWEKEVDEIRNKIREVDEIIFSKV